MKRWMIATAAVGVAAIGIGAAALAHGPGGSFGGRSSGFAAAMIDALDSDGDAKVSRAEMRAAHEQRLSEWDTDANGSLSPEEFGTGVQAMIEQRRREMFERRFAAIDVDGDGAVSAAEFSAAGAERFGRLDRNGDGFVEFLGRGGGPDVHGRGGPPAGAHERFGRRGHHDRDDDRD